MESIFAKKTWTGQRREAQANRTISREDVKVGEKPTRYQPVSNPPLMEERGGKKRGG